MAKKKILMRGKDDEFGNTYIRGMRVPDAYEVFKKAVDPPGFPNEWGVKSSAAPARGFIQENESLRILPTEEVSFILKKAAELSDRKRKDYAGADPDENFTRSAKFAGLVCKGLPDLDRRRATATLIGVKLARLANLGLGGSTPEHESVDDTLTDLINYVAILKRQNMRARRES